MAVTNRKYGKPGCDEGRNSDCRCSVASALCQSEETRAQGAGAFFLFAGMSVLAWIFFFFFLPETKGRSLEEMKQVFTRGRKSRDTDVELQKTGMDGARVM
ncbi:probable polyol transporter 6 [Tanacetum coccineum]